MDEWCKNGTWVQPGMKCKYLKEDLLDIAKALYAQICKIGCVKIIFLLPTDPNYCNHHFSI